MMNIMRPGSLAEAVDQFRKDPEHTRYIAGGTEVNRQGHSQSLYQGILIFPLLDASISRKGKGLSIGAGAVLQDLADHPEVPSALRKAAKYAVSRTLRCMATVGGNIAAARDDSYLLPVLAASRAELHLSDGQVLLVDTYLGEQADLAGSIITKVVLPDCSRPVYLERVARSSQTKAALSIACSIDDEGFSIYCSAAGQRIRRLHEVESAAAQSAVSQAQMISLVQRTFHPADDITGSTAYKQYLAGVYITQALEELQAQRGEQ